ncbi:MAG: ABC transporter substrate-binding protein [Desertimonas sp.]
MTSRRRSAAFLSVLAGASLIVAGSGNAGATTPTTAPEDTATEDTTADTAAMTEDTASAATTGETTAETTGDTTAGTAVEGAEIGGSACGTPHGPWEPAAAEPSGEVRVAWNDPLLSFNSTTTRDNATANNNPLYLMNLGGFSFYDADLNLINNDSFGTCTLDSLDPLTITYTINDGVTWSDGVQVDAADLVLHWAAQSGVFNAANTVVTANGITAAADDTDTPIVVGPDGTEITAADEEAYAAAFDPEGDTGAELLEGYTYKEASGAAFDSASEALELVTQFPTISEDGRSVTITFDSFYVDYETGGLSANQMMPAHVVGSYALAQDDPAAAKAGVLAALQAEYAANPPSAATEDTAMTEETTADTSADTTASEDTSATTTATEETTTPTTAAGFRAPAQDDSAASVRAISEVWNTAFSATSLPDDPGLYVGYGPYNLVGYTELSELTFEAREDYAWGPTPLVQTIVYRIIGEPTAAVQAMENEEVDIIQPQATADILTQLEGLADRGVEVSGGDGATYEHVDLAVDNGGPFDPAAYDGDEATALAVRQAFLHTIPRQEIVDRLIVPLNPDATVRESFAQVPGSPDYDATVAGNGSGAYAGQDIELATQILTDAGVDTSTPIDVRFLYAANNPRRASEYELIRDAAAQAGFNVIDGNSPTWGQDLSNTSVYDAALFGWQSTAIAQADTEANYVTGGQNNFYGFSNAEVDALYQEIKATTDPVRNAELLTEVEALLYENAFGLPIFQHPAITAWNSTYVSGVDNIALAPTVFYNFWEWAPAA